jgi:serine protease Do
MNGQRRTIWRGSGTLVLVVFLIGVVSGGIAVNAAGHKHAAEPTRATDVAVPAAQTDRSTTVLRSDISDQRKNAIVRAAQRAGPSVVSISVMQTRVVSMPFRDPFFEQFFGQFFPEQKQEVPALGSGFIVDGAKGYVFTNEHVVHGAERIKVTLTDGREFEGKLIGSDETYDLAIVQIRGTNLPVATLGTSSDLIVGEWAIAIGNPFGFLLSDNQPTVTAGVISAVHRTVKSSGGQGIYKDMVQTDAAINPGNSGGPLVNAEGQVIGINTFIFSQSGGSVGIGFAIPIDRAKKVLHSLVTVGYVPTPWVGLNVEDLSNLSPYWLQRLNIRDTSGIIVTSVEDGSPADKAGIQPGDIIRRINNRAIASSEEARQAFFDAQINSVVTLTIQREGKTMSKSMTLTEVHHP